ncbi:MAG: glycosyltransferase family 2 protein, partial [Lachnospiraceae bacterium]
MSEKKRPVLSISMLVSNNRRDTIEKCMESLVPLRKAVPSELIIVDTGCTDGSVDIAEKYADKVIEFPWCNDFSAARNAGLSECTGEWFLYLDDDEWFEDVTELIAFFLGEEQKYCDALWYLQRNYDDFEGTSYVDTYVGRVVKRTPDTRFCGKIHEWLEPLPKMIKKANAYVHHYGYVYKNEEERKKHLLRNLTLEEAAVKEHPEDIRMCSQLVQEYRAAERYEDAKSLCLATLKNTKYAVTNSFV